MDILLIAQICVLLFFQAAIIAVYFKTDAQLFIKIQTENLIFTYFKMIAILI